MKMKVSGHFTVRVLREDGSVREHLEFDNIIVDNGMDRIAGSASAGAVASWDLWDRVVLSTNNTAPSTSDAVMGGTTVNSSSPSTTYPNGVASDGSPTYQLRWQSGFKFATGSATGTWSSIGLMFNTTLFCRTLIKSGGTPTTLTITAAESLDIRYEIRILPVITDTTGSVTINGTSFNWTARAWGLNDAFGVTARNKCLGVDTYGYYGTLLYGASLALGSLTAGNLGSDNSPPHSNVTNDFSTGGSRSPSSKSWGAYSSGSFTRALTYTWSAAHVGSGGVTQFNGMTIRPGGICPPLQVVFSAPVTKLVTEQFSITFDIAWTRT